MELRRESPTSPTRYTLEEALAGTRAPRHIRKSQALLDVEHVGFDGKSRDGQLVIHHALKSDVAKIFAELYQIQFPIERVAPAVVCNWDDDELMAKNISTAFNYRVIAGTNRISNHAFGRAIDINPLLNPFLSKDGIISPRGAVYDPRVPGTIIANGLVVNIFKRYGFKCGIEWKGPPFEPVDTQHFERVRKSSKLMMRASRS